MDATFKFDKLDGTNYATWSLRMQMTLMQQDLWAVVSKDLAASLTPEEGTKDQKALALIGLGISDALLLHVRDVASARQAWQNLKETYEGKGLASVMFLRRKFFGSRMEAGSSVMKHVASMVEMSHQLKVAGSVTDNDIVMTILGSLPTQYDTVVTMLETLPAATLTVDFILGRLMHEEAKMTEAGTLEASTSNAMMVQGHQNRRAGRFRGRCFSCGEFGHIAAKCPQGGEEDRRPGHGGGAVAKRAQHRGGFAMKTASSSGGLEKDAWIVDSGASHHLCKDRASMSQYAPMPPVKIHLADNRSIMAVGRGRVTLRVPGQDGESELVTLREVWYVPGLESNLLSVKRATDMGVTVSFWGSMCIFRAPGGETLASATKRDGLYILDQAPAGHHAKAAAAPAPVGPNIWHQRLGHVAMQTATKLAGSDAVTGMALTEEGEGDPDHKTFCETCALTKMTHGPYPHRGHRADAALDLIHTDVCGPVTPATLGGAAYVLTLIDDHSRHVWMCLMRTKSEAFGRIKEWETMVTTQTGRSVKCIRSDGGGEYMSKAMDQWCKAKGILRQVTVPYTPQQNGVAERMNRTLLERARAMIRVGGPTNKGLWGEAVATAVYLTNRLPASALGGMTPHQALWGRVPDLGHLRVFGCDAFARIPDVRRRKLDDKGAKMIMVGYAQGTKGYRLLDPNTGRIHVAKDVLFHETSFSCLNPLDHPADEDNADDPGYGASGSARRR